MYSATPGRWIGEDPSGSTDGSDLFASERSNPVRFMDPTGLQAATQPSSQPSTQPSLQLRNGNGTFGYNMNPFKTYIGGPSGLQGMIAFSPSGTCPKCKKIRFIQAIQILDANNNAFDVPDDKKSVKNLMTNADPQTGVAGGYIIDFDPGAFPKGPASPYYADSYGDNQNEDGSSEVFLQDATLFDSAHVNLGKWKYTIETVAVCADTGAFLGSITWGFSFAAGTPPTPIAPIVSNGPSPSFRAAQKNFTGYNSGR